MSTDKIDRNNSTEAKAELTEEELAMVSAGGCRVGRASIAPTESLSRPYEEIKFEYTAQKS